MFIINNTTILNQYNSLVCKKSHFKTFAIIFLISKNKQYVFKINVADSINSMIMSSVEKFIKTFINIFLNDDLIIMIFDSIIYKFLKFK